MKIKIDIKKNFLIRKDRIVEAIKFLYDKIRNPFISVNSSKRLLEWVVEEDLAEIGEFILSDRVYINAQNMNGKTLLHRAIDKNAINIAELLISKGADTSAKNNKGETPLDCTKKESNTRSVTPKDKKKMEQLLLPKGQ